MSRTPSEAELRGLLRLQDFLVALYDIPCAHRVADFLCDEDTVRCTVGEHWLGRRELLIVSEEEEGSFVGLYLHPSVRENLARSLGPSPRPPRLDLLCEAIEGVSHFLFYCFRSSHELPVSQLELEVQAEVDKYATMLLAGRGVGAIRERSRKLRHQLFAKVRYIDMPGTPSFGRYHMANRVAAHFTERLERALSGSRALKDGSMEALRLELRRFYRSSLGDKARRAGLPSLT